MSIALKNFWSVRVIELKFFTLVALAAVLVSSCPYAHFLYQALLLISLAYGVFLLCRLFLGERLFSHNKYFPLLMLFVISYCITILLNCHQGFFTNCGQLAYTCLYFFVFFCHYSMLSSKQRAEILRPALWLILVFALVIAGISLVMLLMQYHGTYELQGTMLYIGVTSRADSLQLTGITSSGPTLSGLCFSGILASILLYYSDETQKWKRRFCLGAAVVLLLTICAANAYAGLVNLAAFGFSCAACYVLTGISLQHGTARARRICLAALAAGIVSVCIFVGYFSVQNAEAAFINRLSEGLFKIKPVGIPGMEPGEFPPGELPGQPEGLPDVTIRRSILSSINSGRFDIWRATIDQLFLVRPLFGWTNANASVKVFYGVPDYVFFNLHSGYLTLLASAGLIGFSLMILFGLLLLVRTLRFLFSMQSGKASKYLVLLVSSCIGILAGDLVNGCFVLWRGHSYILLWIFLGEIYALTKNVSQSLEVCCEISPDKDKETI